MLYSMYSNRTLLLVRSVNFVNKVKQNNSSSGFTLIELVIVMIILGIIAALITGNFFTSLKKGRDAQRKAALSNVQRALELYYEDFKKYPASNSLSWGSPLCHPNGCDVKVYMSTLPRDPVSSQIYRYCTDNDLNPQKYQLFAWLENSSGGALDPQIITPSYLTNCGSICSTTTNACNYGIASSNSSPTSP